jgi:DNA-directed RNA polymerase subunit RPC12/RpoP
MSYCINCGKEFDLGKYFLKRCPACQEVWRIENSKEDLQ